MTKLALALAITLNLPAQELAAETELPRIDVIGEGEDAVARQPGSVAVITEEALELMQPLSTQDALKTVPGIVAREEEGYGFIPNIGMRGLNPNRSQKLLCSRTAFRSRRACSSPTSPTTARASSACRASKC